MRGVVVASGINEREQLRVFTQEYETLYGRYVPSHHEII